MTLLCLDFGNTSCKAVIIRDGEWIATIDEMVPSVAQIESIIQSHQPTHSILVSVIHHDSEVETVLKERTVFHMVSAVSLKNFIIKSGKPETLGTDRIALVAAAVDQFPQKNTLIISLGTCITYNFVNQYGHFLGGSISPGLEMRFRSLHDYTAKLPKVEADWNFPLIGYDTKTNLQSGVIVGLTAEIDGFIDRYSERYDNFNVILTGGNSPYFAGQLKNRIFADKNFLFKGLYALSQLNQPDA
jgi:type III pantothenate kinase